MNTKILEHAKRFKELKAKSAEQDAALKETNKEWDECELQLLEAMIEEGVNSINIDGLGLYSMRTENYLSVNAANKPVAYGYLKESGNGSLLKEEVNPRTLTAFLKGHLADLIKARVENTGVDEVIARQACLEFLNSKGVNYFTKRGVALKEK